MSDQDFIVTRKQVDQVEGLLPFLFSVQGNGEAEARDAAEALMAMLDLTTVVDIGEPQPGLEVPGNVLMFPLRK